MERIVFQPSFFRGYVKLREGKRYMLLSLEVFYGWDFWRSSTELTSLITPQFQVEPNPKR